MKSSGILVNKEQLRSNYKLTFEVRNKTFTLILHQDNKGIFINLRIGIEYQYLWFKGKKNYYFIIPRSIREKYTSFKPISELNTRNIFFAKLAKQLKIKALSNENIKEKLKVLMSKIEIVKIQDQDKIFVWIFDLLKTLFIKHRGLKLMLDTPEAKEERQLLQDLETMFLFTKFHSQSE